MLRACCFCLFLLVWGGVEGLQPLVRQHTLNDYSEYWQQFFWTMWGNDSLTLGTYVKIDSKNHMRNVRSYQLSEQLAFKVTKHFSCELHYSYLHSRSVVPNSLWRWQHRLELEVNPTFQLSRGWLIETRNRLEIRRLQREPKILYRLRQRTMLVIPFKGESALKAFSLYNELFYDLSTHLFTQDRICPCQLTFALPHKMELDLFFLLTVFNSNDIWRRCAVLGTQLSF